jgi:hypothetical protein
MIILIFSAKNSAKKLAFLTENKAKLCKFLIITLVFEKNANFFAKNCQKSQKIVIITSTPDGGSLLPRLSKWALLMRLTVPPEQLIFCHKLMVAGWEKPGARGTC